MENHIVRIYQPDSCFMCPKIEEKKRKEILSSWYCSICNENFEYDDYDLKYRKYGKCYPCMCKEKCVDCKKPRNNEGSYWRCKACVPIFLKNRKNNKSIKSNQSNDPFDN